MLVFSDQLLLVLQCILSSNGYLIPEHFAFRLQEWTKIGFPELGNKKCCGVGFTVGSVIDHPDFLEDPHKAAFDIWSSMGCNLAANGAVMRTAVLGIPLFFNERQVALNAIDCAKVTHADPRCIFSSVVVSALISRMFREALEIVEAYQMNDSEKENLLKIIESKKTQYPNSLNDCDEGPISQRALQKSQMTLLELCVPKSEDVQPPKSPNYYYPDLLRLSNPVECFNDPNKFSIASCGQDDPTMDLIKQVVSDYRFLLSKNECWRWEAEKFCFSNNIHEIELDEENSIGYTLKCLGAALFCFARKQKAAMTNGDFFMQVITQLVLEAGDADTNGAVAGALLGCRLGLKGLPSAWLDGLRNKEFLMKISEELLELVMKQLESV